MVTSSSSAPSTSSRNRRGLLVVLFLSIVGVAALVIWQRSHRSESSRGRDFGLEVAGSESERPENHLPAPLTEGYVGSEACASCHGEIARAYQAHPMAGSISPVNVLSPELNLDLDRRLVRGKSRFFLVEGDSGELRHHERMLDAAGELIFDQAVAMEYVVGSGRRAKAYLYGRGDLLFMSPLNWYSQSERWDLAPGYIADDPRRFDRRVTDECLSCHVGRAAIQGRGLNRFQHPPFQEMAIGCENCHGPGEAHVAFRSSDSSTESKDDPIVNPVRLDPARRDSVCFQCHLQAAARIPRLGRTHLDYRPGMLLEEVWTVLDGGSDVGEDGRTRSVNHVQQMRESRCFLASEGNFGCTSCHDPHRVFPDSERVARYRERCLKCHHDAPCSLPLPARQKQDDSCIACHMPTRDSSNVAHVTQTDHRVLRLPVSDRRARVASESLTFLDRADLRLSPLERDRALGLGVWVRFTKTGRRIPAEIAQLLAGVHAQVPDDGVTMLALGDIALQDEKVDLARRHYEEALRIPEAEEAALNGLLDLYYVGSDREKALQCATRLIEIDPGNAKAYAIQADLLRLEGRLDDGIASARQALKLNPTLIPVRAWLADSLGRAGDEKGKRDEQQLLERMRVPRFPGTD